MNINKNFLLSLILNLVLTVISSNLFGEISRSQVGQVGSVKTAPKVVYKRLFQVIYFYIKSPKL